MRERRKRRVHHAARQAFADVRIPEDATHERVAFFGQKKVRIYPLRRPYFCGLFDGPGTAPSAPVVSTTLTQFFPHMVSTKVGAIIRIGDALPRKKSRSVKLIGGDLSTGEQEEYFEWFTQGG